MFIFVVLLGSFIICIGLACFISPHFFQRLLATFGQGQRLYWISLFRLAVGGGLLAVAPHFPSTTTLLLILGSLFMVSGIIGLVLGPQRLKPMVDWWASRSAMMVRLWSLLAMGLGGGLLYAVLL